MIADEGPQHKRPVDQVIAPAEEIRELHRRPRRMDYLVWGKLGVMAGGTRRTYEWYLLVKAGIT